MEPIVVLSLSLSVLGVGAIFVGIRATKCDSDGLLAAGIVLIASAVIGVIFVLVSLQTSWNLRNNSIEVGRAQVEAYNETGKYLDFADLKLTDTPAAEKALTDGFKMELEEAGQGESAIVRVEHWDRWVEIAIRDGEIVAVGCSNSYCPSPSDFE